MKTKVALALVAFIVISLLGTYVLKLAFFVAGSIVAIAFKLAILAIVLVGIIYAINYAMRTLRSWGLIKDEDKQQ